MTVITVYENNRPVDQRAFASDDDARSFVSDYRAAAVDASALYFVREKEWIKPGRMHQMLDGSPIKGADAMERAQPGAVVVALDNGELDIEAYDRPDAHDVYGVWPFEVDQVPFEPDELWFDFVMNRPDDGGRVVNWAQA